MSSPLALPWQGPTETVWPERAHFLIFSLIYSNWHSLLPGGAVQVSGKPMSVVLCLTSPGAASQALLAEKATETQQGYFSAWSSRHFLKGSEAN